MTLSIAGELEDKLRKDQTQKQELERTKRKMETELNDVKDQLSERKQQVKFIFNNVSCHNLIALFTN